MNTIQRITKNISFLFISLMMSYVFGFVTLIFSARYLGVEGFGILSSALALTSIFSVFMDLGFSTLTIRELARNKSFLNHCVGNILTIKLMLSLISVVIIFLLINLSKYNQQSIYVIYFVAFYAVFNSFSLLFLAVFQANQKMEYQSLSTIFSSVLLLAGVLLAIYTKFNIIQFSIIYTVVGALNLVFTIFIFSLKFSLPKIKLDLYKWKKLVSESWPFAISGISYNFYTWVDTIILAMIIGQEAVGLYNAAYKLVFVFLFVPTIFNTAIFPLMSQYYISSKYYLNLTFEKLFKMMMIVAIPLGVGTVIIANKVIIFVYGEQFIGAVIAMQILIWSIVLIFARSPFERYLESSNKQLTVTKIFLIGVIANITLNIIVIPKYSYVGAAIVTVLTDIIVMILFIISVKELWFSIFKKVKLFLIKIVLSSLIMGVIVYCLLKLNLFLLIGLGCLIYISLILAIKIFDEDEIIMIKSIFRKE